MYKKDHGGGLFVMFISIKSDSITHTKFNPITKVK